MALGTEGHANASFAKHVTGGTINVTTAGTNRILYLEIAYEQPTTASSVISIATVTDTAGNVWQQRFKYQKTLTQGQTVIETWWAKCAAQVTALAVSFTTHKAGATEVDGLSACIVAISGVQNFTDPFDTNASIVGSAINTGAVNHPNIPNISTDNPRCVLLQFWNTDGPGSNPSGLAADTGWTLTSNLYNPNPSFWNYAVCQEKITTSQLVNTTVQFGGSTLSNWISIVDAITDAAAPSGPTEDSAALLIGV